MEGKGKVKITDDKMIITAKLEPSYNTKVKIQNDIIIIKRYSEIKEVSEMQLHFDKDKVCIKTAKVLYDCKEIRIEFELKPEYKAINLDVTYI